MNQSAEVNHTLFENLISCVSVPFIWRKWTYSIININPGEKHSPKCRPYRSLPTKTYILSGHDGGGTFLEDMTGGGAGVELLRKFLWGKNAWNFLNFLV